MCNIYLKLLLCLILLVINFNRTTCFNIEDREPYVKIGASNSYFGYSLALHQTEELPNSIEKNWILVGAPLGHNLQPNTNRSGALYKCPITSIRNDCEQIETDGKRLDEFDYGENDADDNSLEAPQKDEIKEDQWLGVTVKSQKPGGNVMVCAHRYIQSPNLHQYQYGYGLCYLLDNNLNTIQAQQPCKGRPVDKLHQQFGFCQVGTSLAFFEDGVAAMGAPGPFTWRGTIFVHEVAGQDFMYRDKTMYHGPLNDNRYPIDKYSYMGMSVDGGKFFQNKPFIYISGAPRSNMTGQVFFMNKISKSDEMNILELILNGTQLGSGFGYQLLVTDLNNDGYDDLLVGAPFFFQNGHGGAVYVYTNLRNCNQSNCEPDQILYGHPQSRFGFAITSIGDINKDGYMDVAIGAPYEPTTNQSYGVVYIYLGANNGLHPKYSQKIKSKLGVKTFGHSLNGGLDMDLNNYPDLVVGAYESDLVAFYRTRPIINILIKIRNDEEMKKINATKKGCKIDPNNTNNTCFSFEVCFQITEKIKDKFNVNYTIKEVTEQHLTSRIWFKNDRKPDRESERTEIIRVSSNKQYCTKETAYIKQGVSDILQSIKFLVKYTMEANEIGSPILNTTSVKTLYAVFQKDCGDDDLCQSELVLNANTDFRYDVINNGYIVDNITGDFILHASVENKGEPAYGTKLFIVHPRALSYIALKEKNENVHCSVHNDTLIACELGNPLNSNKTIILKLRFEIVKSTKEEKLNLNIFVNSTSDVELSQHTSVNIIAILRRYAQFDITSIATQNLFYGGKIMGEFGMKTLDDIGTKVTHTVHIENTGEWDISDVNVSIHFPYQTWQDDNAPGKWLFYLEMAPILQEASFGSFCTVLPPTIINPLGLTSHPRNSTSNFARTTLRQDQAYLNYRNYIVPMQTIKVKGDKTKRVVTMECVEGSAKCALINCHIVNFQRGQSTVINIKSRIWNSTLVEDYSNVDWVSLKAYVNVTIDSTLTIADGTKYNDTMETIAYPDNILQDIEISWWWIVIGVVAGLLLLIILSIILYKCGFFRRHRVKDPTLTGNIVEHDELLKNKT